MGFVFFRLACGLALLYDGGMKGCLGIVFMLLLVGAAGLTVAFNFLLNQSLDFEPKSDPSELINTRRSFRPFETQQAPQEEELQATVVE